jgi:formylmethanofuran dehydrogenase subunit E
MKLAKIKRFFVMPFARKKQVEGIKVKTVREIMDKEQQLHEGFIRHQRQENNEMKLEYQHKRDALRWVLNKH